MPRRGPPQRHPSRQPPRDPHPSTHCGRSPLRLTATPTRLSQRATATPLPRASEASGSPLADRSGKRPRIGLLDIADAIPAAPRCGSNSLPPVRTMLFLRRARAQPSVLLPETACLVFEGRERAGGEPVTPTRPMQSVSPSPKLSIGTENAPVVGASRAWTRLRTAHAIRRPRRESFGTSPVVATLTYP